MAHHSKEFCLGLVGFFGITLGQLELMCPLYHLPLHFNLAIYGFLEFAT